MSDVINLGTRMQNLDVSPQFDTYSKVIIHIDNDTQVSAGNDSGRTLEVDNPLGTQALANEMLARLRGFQYQPYTADGALLDPAAEIGDAVNTTSTYGGIYTRSRTFGRLMKADISAPCDEEINHEYTFESPQERKFKREMGDVRASLIIQSNMIQAEVTARQAQGDVLASRITQTSDAITAEVTRATAAEGTLSASLSVQATQIAAKVNASGGGGSFSWVLDSSSHTWKSNNTDVMRISASGLWLKGQIEASSGKIGGFDIGANALTYNGLNYGDTYKNYGAYIGQSGIQLGKNFKVDNAGNVTAANLAISGGSISIGSNFSVSSIGNVTANNMAAANLSLSGTLNMNGVYITPQDLANRASGAYDWTSNNGSYCTGGVGNWYGAKSGYGYATDIWAHSFHGSETSYFSGISVYSITHYSTGRVFRPLYLNINGSYYYIWGASA